MTEGEARAAWIHNSGIEGEPREDAMATEGSIQAILSLLDAQIAHDREKEAFHAQQEAFHREQRALFAAELEKLTAVRESLQTAADTALDLVRRGAALQPPKPSPDIGGRRPSLTKMVTRIIEIQPPGKPFGPNAIARAINHHYKERMRGGWIETKLVSIVLRRMAADGRIRAVRPGRPHQEGLYARKEG